MDDFGRTALFERFDLDAWLHVDDDACAEEHFLQYVTPDDRLAGFLRLSLPDQTYPGLESVQDFRELQNTAIVREVHVYGQALAVGDEKGGAAQHIGLGTALLEKAEEITRQHRFQHLAVISAVGTYKYYASQLFFLLALLPFPIVLLVEQQLLSLRLLKQNPAQ